MGLVIFWIIMAAICGAIANSKGRSFLGYFVFGLIIWPVALIALMLSSNSGGGIIEQGRPAVARRDIALDDGTVITKGTALIAGELSVREGVHVSQIEHDGGTYWIRSAAMRAVA